QPAGRERIGLVVEGEHALAGGTTDEPARLEDDERHEPFIGPGGGRAGEQHQRGQRGANGGWQSHGHSPVMQARIESNRQSSRWAAAVKYCMNTAQGVARMSAAIC